MARLGVAWAGIALLVVAGAAVLSTVGITAASSGAGQATPIALFAVDADPQGNGPRSVGTIEQCVSATVGQPVQVDIVIPGPGIPADRGVSAYQFSILYDPAVVWIGADDSDMLLAQAAGSNVIPIADSKPDTNGVYQSWGLDFGPSGIEPAGSSETGPGVLARITLLPRSEGVSTLTLSNVLVIDDASERISLESVQPGTIHVGEPCGEQAQTGETDGQSSEQGQQTDPSLTDSKPTPGPTPATLAAATPARSPESPGAVPNSGSAPPPAGGAPAWFIVSGLITVLGGTGLLAVGKLAFGRGTRATLPLGRTRSGVPPDSDSANPRIRRE